MTDKNCICVCGHLKSFHWADIGCLVRTSTGRPFCKCPGFARAVDGGFEPKTESPAATPRVPRDYHTIAEKVANLVTEKQIAYGDSFGKSGAIMAILYPKGIPLEKMNDALTVVRVLDKLFRIATDRDALGESPWSDIMGYALLALLRQERAQAPIAAPDEPVIARAEPPIDHKAPCPNPSCDFAACREARRWHGHKPPLYGHESFLSQGRRTAVAYRDDGTSRVYPSISSDYQPKGWCFLHRMTPADLNGYHLGAHPGRDRVWVYDGCGAPVSVHKSLVRT